MDLFDMAVHPSLEQPTDEVQVLAQASSRAIVL